MFPLNQGNAKNKSFAKGSVEFVGLSCSSCRGALDGLGGEVGEVCPLSQACGKASEKNGSKAAAVVPLVVPVKGKGARDDCGSGGGGGGATRPPAEGVALGGLGRGLIAIALSGFTGPLWRDGSSSDGRFDDDDDDDEEEEEEEDDDDDDDDDNADDGNGNDLVCRLTTGEPVAVVAAVVVVVVE
jgi:hypothetical protein